MAGIAVIAARFGLYLTLVIALGLSCFRSQAWRDSGQEPAVPLMRMAGIAASLAIPLSAFQLVALAASMSGTALSAVDRSMLALVLDSGAMAIAWKVRMAALVIAVFGSVLDRRAPRAARFLCAASGAVALATMAWFGHGAADDGSGGWIHLVADILHLWAAGLWAGALVGLCLLLLLPPPGAGPNYIAFCESTLASFAGLGTLIVATLIVTGLANSWFLIGIDHIGTLATDPYGRLLLVKLAAFGAMLVLAASNRFRLTPGLAQALTKGGDPARPLTRLRLSLLTETGMLMLILWLVAWFGTLSPPGGG